MKRMLLIAVLAGLALVSAASAAKPVKPPPPPPPPPQGTLVFSVNPVHPYQLYNVSGCGFPASTALTLEYEQSWKTYGYYFPFTTDSAGCFNSFGSIGTFQANVAGTSQEFTVEQGQQVYAEAVLLTVDWP